MEEYKEVARKVRLRVLDMIHRTKSPHIGSSYSCVEVLVALYFNVLKVEPGTMQSPDRDRFIMSKGHACPALYAVLTERGYINEQIISGFAVDGGMLEHHPARNPSHGIELSSGSLGHGLSVGVGMALASKLDKTDNRVYVLMSDGELNEGSVWEAVMFAAHHQLNNLVAILDCNRIQALGFTCDIINLDPLAVKWRDFGWHAQELNGHDFNQLYGALGSLSDEKPNVLVLHTVKGKGVSFMENELLWHYRAPNEAEYSNARSEIVRCD